MLKDNKYQNLLSEVLTELLEDLEKFEPLQGEGRCNHSEAYFVADPYDSDVNDQIVVICVCEYCEGEIAADI